MSVVLEIPARMETQVCGQCGMHFSVPEAWISRRRNGTEGDARDYYCPAGHCRTYTGETEAQRLKRELEAKERSLKWAEERVERLIKDRDHHQARANALKGVVTKVKRRVGHGSCPCCNRHFQNLRRHMTSKHPDYAESEAEK